jgi:hypothetical protein
MSRKVIVTIDRLMLHGVARADRAAVAEGLQAELQSLFADHADGAIATNHPPVVKAAPIRAEASGLRLGRSAGQQVFKAIVR